MSLESGQNFFPAHRLVSGAQSHRTDSPTLTAHHPSLTQDRHLLLTVSATMNVTATAPTPACTSRDTGAQTLVRRRRYPIPCKHTNTRSRRDATLRTPVVRTLTHPSLCNRVTANAVLARATCPNDLLSGPHSSGAKYSDASPSVTAHRSASTRALAAHHYAVAETRAVPSPVPSRTTVIVQ